MMFSFILFAAQFASFVGASAPSSVFVQEFSSDGYVIESAAIALDTCMCNATACGYNSAEVTSDNLVNKTTSTYPVTGCTGAPLSSSTTLFPSSYTAEFSCPTGIVLNTTSSYSILPGNVYEDAGNSVVVFSYANSADCSSNTYAAYRLTTMYTCGDSSFNSACYGYNMTLAPVSSYSYSTTEYESDQCSSALVVETAAYPTACLKNGEGNDDLVPSSYSYYEYFTATVVGSSSSTSSSNDDSFAVNKDDYAVLIVFVFVAFLLGGGLVYCLLRRGETSPLKERLNLSRTSDNI